MKQEVSKGAAVLLLKNYCPIISLFSSFLLWVAKKKKKIWLNLFLGEHCRITFCLQFNVKIWSMQNFWTHFWLWRANANTEQQHWAFSIASHEMQPTITSILLFPISHPILLQWLKKQADISSNGSLMLPLQLARRGGSGTEQWASLQKDARILQQSLTVGRKLCIVRGLASNW